MSNRNNMKSNEGQPGTHTRTKMNACSSLLTQEENEAVFKMLGKKCQTLNTAVVQIYKTEGSAHSHWKKKYTGVVCFVKDSAIRSYFLRAYCLIENKLIWEHEIYDSMKIIKARPFLLTFEGQDGHVGLNFVSEDECDSFFRAVDSTIETRSRKRAERRSRPQLPREAAVNAPMGQTVPDSTTTVQLRNHSKIHSVTVTPAPAPAAATAAPAKNFLSSAGFGLSTSNKDKKRKFTKAEIGAPTNFVHISHVGWDADKGFDLTGNENDEYLTKFFAKAGVSETELKDRDTRAFIYDFIQSNNVLESVKSETVVEKPKGAAPAPPPVPSRHHHHQNGSVPNTPSVASPASSSSNATSQKVVPPRPPARHPPPPVPTTVPGGGTRAPGPPTRQLIAAAPPPPANISAPTVAPPPPPPPPPPPMAAIPPPPPPMPTITTTQAPAEPKQPSSLPPITDTRNALMESIRKGTTLRKVDTSTHSTGSSDSRNDLMSEIRQGIELRPAQNRELNTNRSSGDDGAGSDVLAIALRRALQERGRVMQSSDEGSDSSDNDDEWDD